MGKTAKLTISLPEEMILFTDEVAKKEKISRSKVISACLRATAHNYKVREMKEGYEALAQENKEFADMAIKIAPEVWPEWK
jgi:metal-responsive CopG/Arc/MetJ family transcriptional regulator